MRAGRLLEDGSSLFLLDFLLAPLPAFCLLFDTRPQGLDLPCVIVCIRLALSYTHTPPQKKRKWYPHQDPHPLHCTLAALFVCVCCYYTGPGSLTGLSANSRFVLTNRCVLMTCCALSPAVWSLMSSADLSIPAILSIPSLHAVLKYYRNPQIRTSESASGLVRLSSLPVWSQDVRVRACSTLLSST